MRAGYVYLLMASFGTLRAAARLRPARRRRRQLRLRRDTRGASGRGLAALVLILALVGAGSKAGLVPLHAWLPLAHPAAPSHVSALMSGVMTKVAVYGFVRIVFDLLGRRTGGGAWWCSRVGGITAVMGVLYALMQHDLKRLLAYHTVENIGIIFIGLGLALAFKAHGMAVAAALALTAALFHVFNHSVFKSLLFFGAGAVLNATGERDMEHLGGFIHRMPQTAFVFLVGCVAISALPPLNGFVSEWLTFQAILLSPQLPSWGLKFLVPAVGALLALSAALAAPASSRPSASASSAAPRTPPAAQRAGNRQQFARRDVFPRRALPGRRHPAGPVHRCAGAGHASAWSAPACRIRPASNGSSIVPIAESRSSYNGLLVFVFVIAVRLARRLRHPSARLRQVAARPGLGLRLSRRRARRRNTPPRASPSRSAACSAHACSARARSARCRRPARPRRRASPSILRDLIWDAVYAPIAVVIGYAAERLNVLQFLTIRRYLTLVFAALVLLLLVLAIWP